MQPFSWIPCTSPSWLCSRTDFDFCGAQTSLHQFFSLSFFSFSQYLPIMNISNSNLCSFECNVVHSNAPIRLRKFFFVNTHNTWTNRISSHMRLCYRQHKEIFLLLVLQLTGNRIKGIACIYCIYLFEIEPAANRTMDLSWFLRVFRTWFLTNASVVCQFPCNKFLSK